MWLVSQSPSRVNSCVTTVIHAEELRFFATPTLQKHSSKKIITFVEREFKMLQDIFNSVDISSCRQQPAGVYEKQPEIKIFSVFHSFFINLIEKLCCTLLRWNVVNALQCSKIELCTTSFGWVYHYSYCKGNTSKFFFFLRQTFVAKKAC